MGILLISIGRLLVIATALAQLLVIADLIMNWTGTVLVNNQYSRLYFKAIDYIYMPIRRYLPTYLGGLDFTPMLAFAVLWAVNNFAAYRLINFGYWLVG